MILASASPRRHELVAQLGWEVDIEPCAIPEPSLRPVGVTPSAWAAALAHFKARGVAETRLDTLVLGADTIVACDDEVLGKPADEEDARRMLVLQAGRACEVITGVCLLQAGAAGARLISYDVTRVWMRDDPVEREHYLESGDWRGKAGAYGIQDVGDRLVAHIDGSFTNVVGLPLERVSRMLAQWLRLNAH